MLNLFRAHKLTWVSCAKSIDTRDCLCAWDSQGVSLRCHWPQPHPLPKWSPKNQTIFPKSQEYIVWFFRGWWPEVLDIIFVINMAPGDINSYSPGTLSFNVPGISHFSVLPTYWPFFLLLVHCSIPLTTIPSMLNPLFFVFIFARVLQPHTHWLLGMQMPQ